MDLRGRLLQLLAPLTVGDEAIPGARLAGASTELGLRLSFDAGEQRIHVEAELDSGAPARWAARSRGFLFSYRTEKGDRAVDAKIGVALCQMVASHAARNEESVLAAIAGDAARGRESNEGGTRVREVRVARLLEPAETGTTPHYTLTPYVGCLIGCHFCYAQSSVAKVRRLEGLAEVPWGSYVDVRVNAAEVLARELETFPPAPIKFCPIVSDPYQAVEARHGVTRACLETIRDAKRPFPTMVLTRASLVLRDVDLLASLPVVYVGQSVPTIDDDVRRHFEPRAAPIAERLEALRVLSAAGVRTFAVVQPILPGSVAALADALAGVVSSVFVHVLAPIEAAETDFADARFVHARAPAWQREHAEQLIEALATRGIPVWPTEMPPELSVSELSLEASRPP